MDEKKQINRAAGVIGMFTLMSRVLGMLRDMVVAVYFGSGLIADAFFVAFRIPNLLRRLFAEGSLTVAFVPVFTEYLTTRTREEAFDLARVVLTVLAIVLTIVTLLGIIFSPLIVRLQAFGFGSSGPKYELTVYLTRIMFPYIFLVSITAFFMGVLNSLRHFAAPASSPIFLNLGIIGAVYCISPYCSQPVTGLAIGVLIGGALQVGIQLPWIFKEGFRIFPAYDLNHPGLKKIGSLLVPSVLGSAAYQLNQFIGTLLASFLPEGSVSWLYYADRIVQFPLGVFAIALSTASLPSLSAYAAKKEYDSFANTLIHSLCLVFFITIPSMAGLMVLSKPIVSLLFQRGAFDGFSTAMTSGALISYTAGLWAFSGISIVVSGFYALQDTKTPVKISVSAMILNAVLSLLLMRHFKHIGLAVALSAASSVQFLILFTLLKKKIHVQSFQLKNLYLSVMRSSASAIVMGAFVYFVEARFLSVGTGSGYARLMNLTILIISGFLTYLGTAQLLGSRETTWAFNLINYVPVKLGLVKIDKNDNL